MIQLGNPEYIWYLQVMGYFNNDAQFIFYLNYLLYWQQPKYFSILSSARGPKCLSVLKMLLEGIDIANLEQNIYQKKPWKNELL